MKLTPKIKKQIDDYFDKITPEDLVIVAKNYGFKVEFINNEPPEESSNYEQQSTKTR